MTHSLSMPVAAPPAADHPNEAQPAPKVRVDSHSLLQGGRELIIQHGDQEYRLRHTQNDKLILTK